MPHYAAERLKAEDASYLLFESPNAHMHFSWLWVFEGGSIARPDGSIDIAAVRRHVAARLFRFPRLRQRLVWAPLEGYPSWVDDDGFKLLYHVQHAALPDPGDERRLRTTAAGIVSQPLDRSKPLWEIWGIEGLAGGRFAIVLKIHHCMMDGLSSIDLMTGLLDAKPLVAPEEPADWLPRPAPGAGALLRDAFVERVRLGADVLRESRRWLLASGAIRRTADAATEALGAALTAPPATPFNGPIGPHRLVDWVRAPLEDLRRAADRLGGSLQDVALAAVAGAVGRLAQRTGARIEGDVIRVVVPVDVRAPSAAQGAGTRTDVAVVSLPIAERDLRRRVRVIARATTDARREGVELRNLDFLLRIAALGGSTLLGGGLALRRRLYACNLVVTDVPGPTRPVYLLDARLAEAYPLVPLLDDQGLGVAFASYDGALHAGVVADWELVPDLAAFAADLRAELAALVRADGAPRRIERVAEPNPLETAE